MGVKKGKKAQEGRKTPPAADASPKSGARRRDFLGRLWKVLGIVALFEFLGVGLTFLSPTREPEKRGAFGGVINAGAADKFAPDTVTAFREGHFYLARLPDGGLLAISRRCTHLGCSVPWVAEEKRFICPCHASVFDIYGNVANPPAPRALDLFPIRLVNGIVQVDTGKTIRRDRFEKSQAVYP